MLGCYVGPAGVAAQGVPERFLNPDADSAGGPRRAPPDNGMINGTEITTSAGGAGTTMAGNAMEVDRPGQQLAGKEA